MSLSSWSDLDIVAEGEPVFEGQKLLRMPDLSRMQVRINVPETAVVLLREGQRARVNVSAFPNRKLTGHVRSVSTAVPRDWYRSGPLEYATFVEIEDDLSGLEPDMYAEVTIQIASLANVLWLPRQAMFEDGDKHFCYVKCWNRIQQRRVVVGQGDQ